MTNSPYLATYPLGARSRRGVAVWVAILLAIVGLALGVLFGLAAGLGNILIAVMFLGLGVGVFLLTKPVWMLWMLGAIVLVLHGLVQFFVGFGQLQWIASALGVGLLFSAAISAASQAGRVKSGGIQPLSAIGMLFLFILVVATVMNEADPLEVLVGVRTYLPYWGVFAVLVAGLADEKQLKYMLYGLAAVAIIQWPVEVYQKVFVVSERQELGYFGSAWDSIVGTFGGAKFGGGASGSLAVFVCCVLIIAISWWKQKEIRTSRFLMISGAVLIAVGLSETKAVFILLPIGAFLLYRKDIVRRPVRVLFGSILLFLVLVGVLFAYYKLFWEDQHRRGTVLEAIENRFAYSFDPTFMPARDWPGRFTGLFIWGRHHAPTERPVEMMLGHGAASATSFSSIIGMGDASRRFGAGLDVTGTTKLLWESGLVGFTAFTFLFLIGYFQAGWLSITERVPAWHRATLKGVQATMPLLWLSLFYEVTSVSSPPMQFLAFFLLGYVGFWRRQTLTAQ